MIIRKVNKKRTQFIKKLNESVSEYKSTPSRRTAYTLCFKLVYILTRAYGPREKNFDLFFLCFIKAQHV